MGHEVFAGLTTALQSDTVSAISSSITKVGTEKFTIKADVVYQQLHCSLKIRMYTTAIDEYAVQFERRTGDAICFISVFRALLQHLRSRFSNVQILCESSRGLPTSCAA